MITPRWAKNIREIKADPIKSILFVLAIAIGVFAVGTLLGQKAVMNREMDRNYLGTNPASATLDLEKPIDEALIGKVRNFPGIVDAEARSTLRVRMKIGKDWLPILLFVVPDFENIHLNKFTKMSGAWPPPTGTMLVERVALGVMQAKESVRVIVKTPHGQPRPLVISGVVHDPGLAPAWEEKTGYAYITLPTLKLLGESPVLTELRISTGDSSASAIQEKAVMLADWLERQGYPVHELRIPPPGQHPHQTQMNTMILTGVIFGFMALGLGALLVASFIAILMGRQVREIGVMKAIGAANSDISIIYFALVLVFCVPAVLIAIPLSRLAVGKMTNWAATMMNLTIYDPSIPAWVYFVQAAAGLLIPLMVAVLPILKGSRMTVKDALSDYGMSQKFGQDSWSRFASKIRLFDESVTLSLRNAFRQSSRFLVNLFLLALAGAIFMTAMNLSAAWDKTLRKIFEAKHYDLDIKLSEPVLSKPLTTTVSRLSGIKAVEAWESLQGSMLTGTSYDIVRTYPDKGHGSFSLLGVPPSTVMIDPLVKEGRWISQGKDREVVLNFYSRSQLPDLAVGNFINLSLAGYRGRWRIVGLAEELPPTAYVQLDALLGTIIPPNTTNMLRIAMTNRDPQFVAQKTREIENILNQKGVSISATMPLPWLSNALVEHMAVLVRALFAMAVIMGLVGFLGLTTAMSMSVLDRTREFGVLQAIGAPVKTVIGLVFMEGFFIAGLSLIFALAFSLPLSFWAGKFMGTMAFYTPLVPTFNFGAFWLWTAILLFGSSIATVFPALRIRKITVRETLVYS